MKLRITPNEEKSESEESRSGGEVMSEINFDDLLEEWIKTYEPNGCARFNDGEWHYINPSFDLSMFGKKFDEWLRERYITTVTHKGREK